MSTQLTALSNILSSGIATIESKYSQHGISFPSIDEPFKPGPLDDDVALAQTIDHVIAAAAQLVALVKPAPRSVAESALSFYLPLSLSVVVSANVPEILREAGPEGLHVKDIGDKCGADPDKMGRILRYLATNHFFTEVLPDTFAGNRMSSVLDTGKSVATLKADPMSKHNDTSGLPALLGHCTDEMLKAAVYLEDNTLDPKTSASQDPLDCPFSRAFGRESVPVFMEKPENDFRKQRFGAAMHGASSSVSSGALLTGFDWKSLKQDALVVDVGGGIGSVTLQLTKAFHHLRYVIQDRPQVIPDGVKFWESEDPEALANGRVQLMAHDFFELQPIMNANVFFLRYVIHTWPDAHAKKILKQLRVAAQSYTKLVLYEFLVPYAAPSNKEFSHILGAEVPSVPFPLLPSLGPVSNMIVLADLQMMTAFNAKERTTGQFIDLVDGTGWKLMSTGRSPKDTMTLLTFDPVDF